MAPLSFQQEGLWTLHQMAPDSGVYNNTLPLRLRGVLDDAALERSIAALVARHEALRTGIEVVDGMPVQRVLARASVPVLRADLRGQGEPALEAWLNRLAREPFELARAPLVRAGLARLDEQEHVLLVVLHHIVSDGWSLSLLLDELAAFYRAEAAGEPAALAELSVQYADYATWQRETVTAERIEREIESCRRQLAGAPSQLRLPTDRPRAPVPAFRGDTHAFELSEPLSRAVNDLAASQQVTPYTVILAAFNLLLHRYSQQDDVVVGTPVSNRVRSELESVVGYFLNVVVVRSHCAGDATFADYLLDMRRASMSAMSRLELPFAKLVERLRPPREPGRSPIFQVLFAWQEMPDRVLRRRTFDVPGLEVQYLDPPPTGSRYDLTLCVTAADRYRASLEYSSDLFDRATAVRMGEDFERVLEAVAADPSVAVSRIPLSGGQPRPERSRPPLARRAGATSAPLSAGQEVIWWAEQLAPDAAVHNLPAAVRVHGRLDEGALRDAVAQVVARHEALRTRLVSERGTPCQVVDAAVDVEFPYLDVSPHAQDRPEAEAHRRCGQYARRPFDLARGPLVRALLVRIAGDDHVLMLCAHAAAADERSLHVLLREIAKLYEAARAGHPSPLPEPPLQYGDFAAWQRGWEPDALRDDLGWWRAELEGAPDAVALPYDHPPQAGSRHAGGRCPVELDAGVAGGLREVARRHEATASDVTLAAFATLLRRYSDQEDLVVGSAVPGRAGGDLADVVGPFARTVPLRLDLSGDPSFAELLGRVRRAASRALAHQRVPFERIAQELAPQRQRGHEPLFQAMAVLRRDPASGVRLPGLEVAPFAVEPAGSKADLALAVTESDTGVAVALDYDRERFEPATVERLARHLQVLLEGIVAGPVRTLSQLPLPDEEATLERFNRTQLEFPRSIGLHTLFERQAAETPDAVAIVTDDEELTYRELNARANRLAHELLARGVRREEFVGVAVGRSPAMVVALLAVLKAGAAYVGLDAKAPRDRIAFMLDDLEVRTVVADAAMAAAVPSEGVDLVGVAGGPVEGDGRGDPDTGVSGADLAYAIYTSGSTGVPKAVGIEHGGAVSFLHWARESFPPDELRGVLATTSPIFDCTLFEIFAPLSWGGAIVLAESVLDLPRLHKADRVTLVSTVPAAIAELLRADGLPASVRAVNLAGDTLSGPLLDQLTQIDTVESVYNHYGPSETTTYSTGGLVAGHGVEPAAEGRPPIGRPIANTQIHIVDAQMRHAPIGAVGELCIAGAGLARGYLNRPDLTARAFVRNPWAAAPGDRLYRTGDLARWRADGRLEFLGRGDRQVKIRGFRIEPGEVEACLVSHPLVDRAVVVPSRSGDRDAQLVAYVVPVPGESPTGADLRNHLRASLPHYMVPSVITAIDSIPLTPNGKVDVRALPEPRNLPAATDEKWRISEPTEVRLTALWRDVLELADIEPTDNFFDLGGHSLLATVMLSRAEEEFGVELPLGEFLVSPTIEGLAMLVRERPKDAVRSSMVKVCRQGEGRPFFCVHPGGADVFEMAQLERGIRTRPVYGLLSVGFNREAEPVASVAEMADHYLREIRAVQPSGPYLIGGFSVGGLVAYEMAQRLRAAGSEVVLLALFDTRVPKGARRPDENGAGLTLNDVLRFDGLHVLASELPSMVRLRAELGARRAGTLTQLVQLVEDAKPFLAAVLAELKDEGYVIPDMGVEEFHRLRDIWARYLWAGTTYRPAPYPGRVTIFKSNTAVPPGGETPVEQWGRLAAEVVEYAVERRHGELFQSLELAETLARCLDEASGELQPAS